MSEEIKFRIGYKAGQTFSGAVIRAISKAKTEMFSVITKVSAYDVSELHTLMHIMSYVFDSFQNTISHVSRMAIAGEPITKEAIEQLFSQELANHWKYALRDFETFKKYEGKD